MTTKEYAKALYALYQESPRASLGKDFVIYLKKKGRLALLPGIIRTLDKMAKDDARRKTCEVVIATSSDAHSALLHAKTFVKDHDSDALGWTFEERVDSSIIGGYIIRTPERELDMSDKGGLYRLYERLRTTT